MRNAVKFAVSAMYGAVDQDNQEEAEKKEGDDREAYPNSCGVPDDSHQPGGKSESWNTHA